MTGFGERLNNFFDLLIPARGRARRLAQENARLLSFLKAVPVEYCGWGASNALAVSPGFCRMLGIEKVSSIEDVQVAITAGDAAALESLFSRLQQRGDPFEIGVSTVVGGRTLKIFGKRGEGAGDTPPFSVLWVHDITDFARAAITSMEAVTAVERRENELRNILNALPVPLWTRSDRLDLTWCNRAYARLIDDTAAAVVAEQKGLPAASALKGDISQRTLAQQALTKDSPQSSRFHCVFGGSRHLLEVTEVPLQQGGAVGVAVDITREEEAELAYKRLVVSHQEAMEQLRTAIAMFDAETRLEFYNSSYEQMTGLASAWLNTKPKMSEIIDRMRESRKLPEQADYRQYKQTWAARFTSLIEPHEEMQYLPDGSVVRMVTVPRPMGGLLLTMEDVTSRLQLETSFNTLMAVQRETIDGLSEGIAVFGEDGRIKIGNRVFLETWGLAAEDISGAPHISKLVDKMKLTFDEGQQEEAKKTLSSICFEREWRQGRFLRRGDAILEYSVVPLPDGNVMNTFFDVTDAVMVDHALREKNAALEEAERLKADFLANVSYQLRTPLNAMMGFAEILHQQYFGKMNERQMEYITNIIEAGQRLVSLINDILDLSSIDAGHMKLYPSEINLHELMKHVAALTEEWARKQRLEISIRCDAGLSMIADERRVKQVLLNLISNAFNHSPHGGKITLSAERDDGFVVLGERDTGSGIPAAELARVFTPFDKISSRKAQRRGGAGLGLALVKSIVELHGGSVAIDSKEGAGTLVSCRLPLRPPQAEKVTAA